MNSIRLHCIQSNKCIGVIQAHSLGIVPQIGWRISVRVGKDGDAVAYFRVDDITFSTWLNPAKPVEDLTVYVGVTTLHLIPCSATHPKDIATE